MSMPTNLKLLHLSLCRTPVFEIDAQLMEKWEELKAIIKESSPSFFEQIATVEADELKTLNYKTFYTIWKYFNRAKFRPVPFNKFAAVSLIPVMADDTESIVLNKDISSHTFIDWKEAECPPPNIQARKARWFITNSCVYTVGNQIRYIRQKNGQFEIATVNGFPELNTVLELCRKKTFIDELIKHLYITHELNKEDTIKLLSQMISLQLIITELQVNITGDDFFKRTNYRTTGGTSTYIIAERKHESGALNAKTLNGVRECIAFLSVNLPYFTNPDLEKFRKAFIKKFDRQTVPLMMAMDPATGIGYGEFGGQDTDFELAEVLSTTRPKENHPHTISYTPLSRFLIGQLIKGGPIHLDQFINVQPLAPPALPNTLSAVIHYWKGHPVVEHAGGCSANTLLGRFTMADRGIEELSRQITDIEEKANPDVLFFDVAYQLEKNVDNVNRRKQIYRAELPFTTWSCDPSPLNLADIWVTVVNSEIILWSKQMDKRIVPRIPSAYNYQRSELAVFRFLCDMQHQGIRSDLNFRLSHLLPELEHYPRVYYKNVIVSPANWLIPDHIKKGTVDGIRQWFNQKEINFHIKVGKSDETLCFDPTNEEDMQAFGAYCKQQANQIFHITEALISDQEVLTSKAGKKHVAQFIINYYNPERLYGPVDIKFIENTKSIKRIVSPGDDWLYFEIYCHPGHANNLLKGPVNTFLKAIKTGVIKWFFIRYEDPYAHLRLRVQLKDPSQGYNFIAKLRSLLYKDICDGLVSDLQIKTYFRETERYGVNRMEFVEKVFFNDSKFIFKQLTKNPNTEEQYIQALTVMQQVISITLPSMRQQISFIKQMADGFGKELNMNTATFKKLNQRYKELNLNSARFFDNLPPRFHQLSRAYDRVLQGTDSDEKVRLLSDLLHMHINRLFHSNQRSHEGVLYQYLLKLVQGHYARSSVAAG
jgi:thiopeptide-type bacteriocin biosynthesis protein